jgi:RimJ/RimL family protein N-acetyltransferase
MADPANQFKLLMNIDERDCQLKSPWPGMPAMQPRRLKGRQPATILVGDSFSGVLEVGAVADPLLFHSDLTGLIRRLRPSELPRFRDHLLRLDTQSRRDRFNGAIGNDFIAAYANRCFAEGTTVIVYVEGDRVIGAAELHERADLPRPTGEIAFSVEREWQRRGIGTALFEHLIIAARGFGYELLRITTHPQNAAARAIARKFGAHLHFEDGDTVGLITLPPIIQPSAPSGNFAGWGR